MKTNTLSTDAFKAASKAQEKTENNPSLSFRPCSKQIDLEVSMERIKSEVLFVNDLSPSESQELMLSIQWALQEGFHLDYIMNAARIASIKLSSAYYAKTDRKSFASLLKTLLGGGLLFADIFMDSFKASSQLDEVLSFIISEGNDISGECKCVLEKTPLECINLFNLSHWVKNGFPLKHVFESLKKAIFREYCQSRGEAQLNNNAEGFNWQRCKKIAEKFIISAPFSFIDANGAFVCCDDFFAFLGFSIDEAINYSLAGNHELPFVEMIHFAPTLLAMQSAEALFKSLSGKLIEKQRAS